MFTGEGRLISALNSVWNRCSRNTSETWVEFVGAVRATGMVTMSTPVNSDPCLRKGGPTSSGSWTTWANITQYVVGYKQNYDIGFRISFCYFHKAVEWETDCLANETLYKQQITKILGETEILTSLELLLILIHERVTIYSRQIMAPWKKWNFF